MWIVFYCYWIIIENKIFPSSLFFESEDDDFDDEIEIMIIIIVEKIERKFDI